MPRRPLFPSATPSKRVTRRRYPEEWAWWRASGWQMVVEEAGQHAPASQALVKTFDFSEGKLEIKRGAEVSHIGNLLKITGFFKPGRYKTGEYWITEELESAEAADR
jgi:hypothetical protein